MGVLFRVGASLETPGSESLSEDRSEDFSELACEDDICTPPLLHAFVHFSISYTDVGKFEIFGISKMKS